MKTLLWMHLIVLLLIFSCNELSSKDDVIEFIPGTYIRFSQHEFGTEYDTLVITVQNKIANEYKILRRWKYERIIDGTPMKAEYKRLTTSGIYNTQNKVLQETETGSLYSFDIKQKLLLNGSTKYQKI